jgi:RNA polymerase sigma-70 factor, ECF subfamily
MRVEITRTLASLAMSATEETFLELIGENEPRLRRICRVYAADEEARRDLYQDILVQLWRAMPSFRGEARASTWLYRVALNTALAHRRGRAARSEVPLKEEQLHADRSPQPDERLVVRERRDRLYVAIQRLGDVDRALAMLYLDDRSYAEIADVLGISENNVGVKLHRLKKKLATWMTESVG